VGKEITAEVVSGVPERDYAIIYSGSSCVNTHLLKRGLAKLRDPFLGGLPEDRLRSFQEAQQLAQSRKVGVWADPQPPPIKTVDLVRAPTIAESEPFLRRMEPSSVEAIIEHIFTATRFLVFAPVFDVQFLVVLNHLNPMKDDTPIGIAGRDFVIERYLETNVRLTIAKLDPVGRFICDVIAVFGNGEEFDIALDLVTAGLGELRSTKGPAAFLKAQADAQASKLGIWEERTRHARSLRSPEAVRVIRVDDAGSLTVEVVSDRARVDALLAGVQRTPLTRKLSHGDYVIADVNGALVRARVDEINEEHAIVAKIDKGEVVRVPLAALFRPPKDILDIAPIAVDVRLAFVEPAGDGGEDAIWKACQGAVFWAHVIGDLQGKPCVLLTETEDRESQSLNLHLLECGIAVFHECEFGNEFWPIRKRFRRWKK
jgi:endonuclease YncB( thermonuclease family)